MRLAMRHPLKLASIFLRCIPAFFRSRNEQVIDTLKQAENGRGIPELVRELWITETTFYRYRREFAKPRRELAHGIIGRQADAQTEPPKWPAETNE